MTDWWHLIDQKAALKEQFPPLNVLRHERPGSATDRVAREFYAAETRNVAIIRSTTEQNANADQFIELMKEHEAERIRDGERLRRERIAKWRHELAQTKGIPITQGMPSLVKEG